MLYASSEKVLSDETATTLQISHRSYTGELWILLGYTIALSVLFRERSSRRKIYLSVNGSVKMRGKCGVYALRDFHEMLPSKSLVFLMSILFLSTYLLYVYAAIETEVPITCSQYPRYNCLRPNVNNRARSFPDHTFSDTSQEKSGYSFSRMRAHNNHIDAFFPDETNDAGPRPGKHLDSRDHRYTLPFLRWDGLQHRIQLFGSNPAQSTHGSSFYFIPRLVSLEYVQENHRSTQFSGEFQRPFQRYIVSRRKAAGDKDFLHSGLFRCMPHG